MSKSKTKQKHSAAKSVAVFFTVFIILEMLIVAGIAVVFRNKDVTPSILGYSAFIMDSGKTDKIPEGSLVFAKNGTPTKDDIGKAVLCENVPGVGSSVFWLNDVTAKGETVDGVIYKVTQGIGEPKTYNIKSDNIIGITDKYYETAGKVISFVSSPIGIIACAVVPLFLLAFIELIIAIVAPSKRKVNDYDSLYDDEDEDESLTVDDVLFDQTAGDDDSDQENYDEAEDDKNDIPDFSFNETNDADDDYSEEETQYFEEDTEYEYEQEDQPVEEETAEEEVTEEEKPHPDAEESISTTRKTASDSLEELMKMMEDEQTKLKHDLEKL